MHAFLKKRFGTVDIMMEWSYNIFDASRRYSQVSASCRIFYRYVTRNLDIFNIHASILSGKSVEGLYHYVSRKVESIRLKFQDTDLALHGGKALGIITRQEIMKTLESLAPEKSYDHINSLKNAIDLDQPGCEEISYRWLFDEKNDSAFSNLLGLQELEVGDTYISDLKAILDNFSKSETMAVADIEQSIIRYDWKKSKRDILQYVALGTNNAAKDGVVNKNKFITVNIISW